MKALPDKCSSANTSLIRSEFRKEIIAQGDKVAKKAPATMHAMAVSRFGGFMSVCGTQFASQLVRMFASNNTHVVGCVGQASIELQKVGEKLQSLDETRNVVGAFSKLYE